MLPSSTNAAREPGLGWRSRKGLEVTCLERLGQFVRRRWQSREGGKYWRGNGIERGDVERDADGVTPLERRVGGPGDATHAEERDEE
jgi:hypothetical protein